jgi:predicted nucleic acid-binding Zn ribbon protein
VGEKYERNPNTNCIVCGKSIYRRPFEIKRNEGRVYCSVECYGISCRKENPCIICGKPILAHYKKKTCSRACANKLRNGIKYKIGQRKSKVKAYKTLKLRLLKCRGRKCERCGYDRFEILQVHHIDENRDNNELENLELICPNCHFEEHLLEKSWLRYKDGL